MTQPESRELNPIEHQWWGVGGLKTAAHRTRPRNLSHLERFNKEEWANFKKCHTDVLPPIKNEKGAASQYQLKALHILYVYFVFSSLKVSVCQLRCSGYTKSCGKICLVVIFLHHKNHLNNRGV